MHFGRTEAFSLGKRILKWVQTVTSELSDWLKKDAKTKRCFITVSIIQWRRACAFVIVLANQRGFRHLFYQSQIEKKRNRFEIEDGHPLFLYVLINGAI